MQGLAAFILTAKAACYVGGGGTRSRGSRPGSHDIFFAAGDWSYQDNYYGGTDFIGQEAVWFKNEPVWAMNYHGAILDPTAIDSARGAEVIRAALSAMYRAGRFLGGWTHDHGPYRYTDASEGDVTRFTGLETIARNGRIVYRLPYHGGLVRP